MQKQELSILIADDHLLVRLGLRHLLSNEYRDVFLVDAASPEEILTQIGLRSWRLVILDVHLLAAHDGFTVLREIHNRHPQVPVLMLSESDLADPARSLELGASGCISKGNSRTDLLKAIKTIVDGNTYFGESVHRGLESVKPAAFHSILSPQERKVLLALSAGKRTSQIAAELELSAKTVSTYKRRLLNKLKLKSTADLIRYVMIHKLSDTDPENRRCLI